MVVSGLFFWAVFTYIAAPPKANNIAVIAPHKALYAVELKTMRSGSQIVNISGNLAYEGQVSCNAWQSTHQFNMRYDYADNSSHQLSNSFATFETFDGKEMDFISKREIDGRAQKITRGIARKNDDSVVVTYTSPKAGEMELPAGVLFPMAHTMDVLEHIKKGDVFFKAIMFDGTDDRGPVEVNAVIGASVGDRVSAFSDIKDIDADLLHAPARRINLAYFPSQNSSQIPEYEMQVIFHENGIISEMVVEYEDFSVLQKLVALEALDSACDNPL